MDYYYSQKDRRWARKKLGESGLDMAGFGCVVTDCAMVLSYFFDREVLPSELLNWLNENNGFTPNGLLYWNKITDFSKGTLRFSTTPNAEKDELTYGIRNVVMGRYNHWVIDHPRNTGRVIDPLLGEERDYNDYTYLNKNRFYLGKPLKPTERSVDVRYNKKRTWSSYLIERKYMFYWVPNTPASYIYKKIGRSPSNRELHGLVYGHWDFATVFENAKGDVWLDYTKESFVGAPSKTP